MSSVSAQGDRTFYGHVRQSFKDLAKDPLPAELAAALGERADTFAAKVAAPFVGITTNGVRDTSGFARRPNPTGASAVIREAATEFLRRLSDDQRSLGQVAFESSAWREWRNGLNVAIPHHGLPIHTASPAVREAVVALAEASLSPSAWATVRQVMKADDVLQALSGEPGLVGEWHRWVTIFGSPDADVWGWQMDGHHTNFNIVVVDDELIATPFFRGAEPSVHFDGPFRGTPIFEAEQAGGLALMASFTDQQRRQAVLEPSIETDDLPKERFFGIDGRHVGGAANDNAVVPYEGLLLNSLTPTQAELVDALFTVWLSYLPEAQRGHRVAEVIAQRDRTYFAWMGQWDDDAVFYYRLHSPVVLIEFDHHIGTALEIDEPTRAHTHTIVRTPNGGDYGHWLIAEVAG
jgi:hypothetical protein